MSSPIFPLHLLLGESLYTKLLQHVQAQDYLFRYPVFSDAHPLNTGQRPEEFVLCLKASAHFADVLVREVWPAVAVCRWETGTGHWTEE